MNISNEVRKYGLKNYDSKVTEQAFNLLDPGNLTKVLRNITTEHLIQIRDKIIPQVSRTKTYKHFGNIAS